MAIGSVKWFNDKKGYGFITLEDGNDIFVHCSAVKRDGFRGLNEGDQVEFEIAQSKRGPKASNVRILQWEQRHNVTDSLGGSVFSLGFLSFIKRSKGFVRSVLGAKVPSAPRS